MRVMFYTLLTSFFSVYLTASLDPLIETPITSFPSGTYYGGGEYYDLASNTGFYHSFGSSGNQTLRLTSIFDSSTSDLDYFFDFIEGGIFDVTIVDHVGHASALLTNHENDNIYYGSGFCNATQCFYSVDMSGTYIEEIIQFDTANHKINKYGKKKLSNNNIIVWEEHLSRTAFLGICGDGILEATFEECDDGDNISGDGCNSICKTEYCGDGIINNNTEQCDDGNTTNGDGCNSTCQIEAAPPSISCTSETLNTQAASQFDFNFAHVSSQNYYDLVVASSGSFKYYVGSPTNSFTLNQNVALTNDSYGVAFADINNDGNFDILTAGPNGSNTSPNTVSLNNSGTFGAPVTLFTSNGIAFYGNKIVTADFNEDNAPDAIWFNGQSAFVAFGPYTTAFPSTPQSIPYTNQGNVYRAVLADFNNDGHIDVGVAVGAYTLTWEGEVGLYINDGAGNFNLVEIRSDNTSFFSGDHVNAFSLAAGDFNNDGKTDIVFPNYSSGHTAVILGLRTSANGQAPEYSFSEVWNEEVIQGIVAGDFDNDGFDDIIASKAGDARILKGDGTGSFIVDSCSLGTVMSPKVIDFDEDGFLDLAYHASGTVQIRFAR